MWHRANVLNLLLLSIFALISITVVSLTHFSPTPTNTASSIFENEKIPDSIIQTAQESTKDLWVNKNGKRFHYHLESPISRIILKHEEDGTEIIEEMEDMRLWIQDRIVTSPRPLQEIRFIQSPLSTFHFSNQELKTQKSFIALYTTPGKDLSLHLKPELVSLRGRADTFDISVDNDGVKFSAKGFTAQINEPGKINE